MYVFSTSFFLNIHRYGDELFPGDEILVRDELDTEDYVKGIIETACRIIMVETDSGCTVEKEKIQCLDDEPLVSFSFSWIVLLCVTGGSKLVFRFLAVLLPLVAGFDQDGVFSGR